MSARRRRRCDAAARGPRRLTLVSAGARARRRRDQHRPRRGRSTASVSMLVSRRRRSRRRRRRPRQSSRHGRRQGRRRRRPRPSRPATSSASTVLVARRQQQHAQGDKFDAATGAVDAFLDAAPAGRPDRPGHLRRHRSARPSSRPPTTQSHSLDELDGRRAQPRAPASTTPSPQAVELAGTDGARSLLRALRRRRHRQRRRPSTCVASGAVDAGVVVDVVSLGQRPSRPTTARRRSPTTPAARSSRPTRTRSARSSPSRPTHSPSSCWSASSSPTASSGEATIDVTRAAAAGTTYTDSAFVTLGAAAASDVRTSSTSRQAPGQHARACCSARSPSFLGLGGVLVGRRSPAARTQVGRGPAARRLLRRRRRQAGARASQTRRRLAGLKDVGRRR